MLPSLLDQLLSFTEISEVLLTYNIVSKKLPLSRERVIVITNQQPQGYGANHNKAFGLCKEKYFCVLNPDVEFTTNPFPVLLSTMQSTGAALVAPKVVNSSGALEVSARKFPSIKSLFKKLMLGGKDEESYPQSGLVHPDWVAGLFMLFQPKDFADCGGFNEAYFLYYEDVEICRRLQDKGKKVVADMSVEITHDGQRASRWSFRHARWHLKSMFRYLYEN